MTLQRREQIPSPRYTRAPLYSSSCFAFEIFWISVYKIEAQRFYFTINVVPSYHSPAAVRTIRHIPLAKVQNNSQTAKRFAK